MMAMMMSDDQALLPKQSEIEAWQNDDDMMKWADDEDEETTPPRCCRSLLTPLSDDLLVLL